MTEVWRKLERAYPSRVSSPEQLGDTSLPPSPSPSPMPTLPPPPSYRNTNLIAKVLQDHGRIALRGDLRTEAHESDLHWQVVSLDPASDVRAATRGQGHDPRKGGLVIWRALAWTVFAGRYIPGPLGKEIVLYSTLSIFETLTPRGYYLLGRNTRAGMDKYRGWNKTITVR